MADTASRDTGVLDPGSIESMAASLPAAEASRIAVALSELTLRKQQHEQQAGARDSAAADDEQDLRGNADQCMGDNAGEGYAACDLSGDIRDAPRAHYDGLTKPQICFDFTKGMCMRGDKCKFSHDLATIVQFNSKEKGICFDYLRSSCQRGLLCRFSHDLSTIAQQCQVFNGIATKGRTNAICYDFVKGVCQRGSECRYSHDLSLIARTARGGANNTRTGEVCYDYLRGRCNRAANCKYSHNISFLGTPGFLPSGMSSDGGGSGPSQSSAGSSSGGGGASQAAAMMLPPQAYHNPAPTMQDGDLSQMGHNVDLEQSNDASAQQPLWSRSSADFAAAQQAAAAAAVGGFAHHQLPPHPSQQQRAFASHAAAFAPPQGGMTYMQQLQQAAVAAASMQQHQQQQQGFRNVRRNSADCANAALAAATAHQAVTMYHRMHGLPPAATMHPLMAQAMNESLGWPMSMPMPGQGHSRLHHDGPGSEPGSLVESYSVPAHPSYGVSEPGHLDAANLACLPPSLLPLLKEIWNK